MKKILKYTGLVILALIMIGYLWFRFFLSFDADASEITQRFEGKKAPVQFTYHVGGQQMCYQAISNPGKPTLLFIHGSPGSWDAFLPYMADADLQMQTQMISIDRPGFGQSGNGEPETSLEQQAAILKPILEKISGTVLLVGHSYGGPVAIRAAIDYPELVDGVMMIAGSADPELEELMLAIQHPLGKEALCWLLPPALDVCNRELIPFKSELKKMEPLWSQVHAETWIIQGLKDELVLAGNADYAERMLTQTNVNTLRLPDDGHFILWSKVPLLKKLMLESLACLAAENKDLL